GGAGGAAACPPHPASTRATLDAAGQTSRERIGKAFFPNLRLCLLDRVFLATERRLPGGKVEKKPGGTRVAVARLADRAGIQEPARVAELPFRPEGRVISRELAVGERDRERDVAVPDKDDRRCGQL